MLEDARQTLETLLNYEVESCKLLELAYSVDTFYALCSAFEVGLFCSLQDPKSCHELAEVLSLHRGTVEKLCDALASRGYLIKQGDLYALSNVSKTILAESSPFYQGNFLRYMGRMRESRHADMVLALKEGPVEARPLQRIFDDSLSSLAMAEAATGGSLQRTIRVLREIPEIQMAHRCLDLGGGHGLFSLAFTRFNSKLEATIFDLPQVVDHITNKMVSGSDRVTAAAGDFLEDDIGHGFDFVFASDVLYKPKEVLLPLLAKIRESLNQDGLLISKHYHIDDLQDDSAAVLFDLSFSLSSCDEEVYSTADFCHLLEFSGFSVTRIEDISSNCSPYRIIIAKRGT